MVRGDEMEMYFVKGKYRSDQKSHERQKFHAAQPQKFSGLRLGLTEISFFWIASLVTSCSKANCIEIRVFRWHSP